MTAQRPARRTRPPLTAATLQELALAYVGRFATSRGKLHRYLAHKVRERGWAGPDAVEGAIERVADAMVALGYVDDSAYAAARARSFGARGLGHRRLAADLSAAGVGEADRAVAGASLDAADAALRFAQRKRIGPYALSEPDPKTRQKQMGALLRAGHSLAIARKILDCGPGEEPDFS